MADGHGSPRLLAATNKVGDRAEIHLDGNGISGRHLAGGHQS
jgi:hypothetical protein